MGYVISSIFYHTRKTLIKPIKNEKSDTIPVEVPCITITEATPDKCRKFNCKLSGKIDVSQIGHASAGQKKNGREDVLKRSFEDLRGEDDDDFEEEDKSDEEDEPIVEKVRKSFTRIFNRLLKTGHGSNNNNDRVAHDNKEYNNWFI